VSAGEDVALTAQDSMAYSSVDIAELRTEQLVNVAGVGEVVDRAVGMLHGIDSIGERPQRLVLHPDQIERLGGDLFGGRRDRGDGVANEPHLVERQRVLVLAYRENPERNGEVRPREDGLDA